MQTAGLYRLLTKEPYKEHCFMKLFLLSLCSHHIRKIGNTYLVILLFPAHVSQLIPFIRYRIQMKSLYSSYLVRL